MKPQLTQGKFDQMTKARHATTCALCDAATEYGRGREVYMTHDDPTGAKCPASTHTRADALRMRCTFVDVEDAELSMEVIDLHDDIGLQTTYTHQFAVKVELEVRVPGAAVRRLIAELTAIADRNGL
jgi:hypothetical protein